MDAKQAKALREPFPASAIGKLPRGGVTLDYVGHAATTDRILAVDPEWTWEPLAYDPQGLPAIDQAGNLWIRLTVAGVTRIGCGDGKNMKERIGDAIRNAAMRFGVALDLWAKEDLHEIAAAAVTAERRAAEPPAETGEAMAENTRKAMFAAFNERGIGDKAEQLDGIAKVIGRRVESRSDLTEREGKAVIHSLKGGSR